MHLVLIYDRKDRLRRSRKIGIHIGFSSQEAVENSGISAQDFMSARRRFVGRNRTRMLERNISGRDNLAFAVSAAAHFNVRRSPDQRE